MPLRRTRVLTVATLAFAMACSSQPDRAENGTSSPQAVSAEEAISASCAFPVGPTTIRQDGTALSS